MATTLKLQPRQFHFKAAIFLASACAIATLVVLAIPMYVIRPFRPQGAQELAIALTVRNAAPWVSLLCAMIALALLLRYWPRARFAKRPLLMRSTLALLTVLVFAGAVASHINIFEIMFHPYKDPAFAPASEVKVDADDKVLSVQIGAESHAYPIRTMGYHHIVNDTVGGQPIAASYCTLCHTGLVWSRILDGRTLHFRLAGINNGNALLRDEETSTIWQQSTGQGIYGPLKGEQLTLVHSDELTFAQWRSEQPQGLVLKPDQPYESEYEVKDWEKHIESTHVVIDTSKSGIAQHELMLGITLADQTGSQSKAFPVKTILTAKLLQDQIGGKPILILVGPDKASIRAFEATLPGNPAGMTFAINPTGQAVSDTETGSTWNFQGCATDGKLKGQCLPRLDSNKDYWFDWLNHHPNTKVFKG